MSYSLRENILQVLSGYIQAKSETFADHDLARLIRKDLPESLNRHCDNTERYIWQGGAGQGNWARCPWLAVFDRLVTDTVQSGYYPAYLFREDITGVYLSLNQGVTLIREKYRSHSKEALKVKAADYLAQLGTIPPSFEKGSIDLRPSSPNNLSAFYQAGNICARFYEADRILSEEELISDFHKILAAYDLLSYNETVPVGSGLHEEDEDSGAQIEDLRKYRQHKRIERNANLSKKAKQIHGYTCKLCGFNFEERYGKIGHHFIEAHHLTLNFPRTCRHTEKSLYYN